MNSFSLFQRLSPAPGQFVNVDGNGVAPPPSSVPAGFDAIAEFSTYLLQHTLSYNLQQSGLDSLSAQVPYQADLVSAQVQAAIATHVRPVIQARSGMCLEVELSNATLTNIEGPPVPPTSAGAATARWRPVSNPGGRATIQWTLSINLFWPQMKTVGPAEPATNGTTSPTGAGIRPSGAVVAGLGTVMTDGSPTPGPGLPQGERVTLAQGTAQMSVPTQVMMVGNAFTCWLTAMFENVQPSYAIADPVFADFLKTQVAQNLAQQAISPLLNWQSVRVSPVVAPARTLPGTALVNMQLPAMQASQVVVEDQAGSVLALCISFGQSGGALGLVRSFLAGHHFAYYASEKLFKPVLFALWNANAVRVPIVHDVPVEMPVDQDSNETGQGVARVSVTLGDNLSDASIEASDSNFGDPLTIVTTQTVQLLRLWDPNGNEITDLGDLAKPAEGPIPIRLQMFDELPNGAQQNLDPMVLHLFEGLLRPVYMPIMEPFSVTRVAGYTSSALRALVVTWSLKRQIVVPVPTAVGTEISAVAVG